MKWRVACFAVTIAAAASTALLQPSLIRARATPSTAVIKGDREFGQYLSAECVTCHQVSGRFDGIPPIIGWPEDTFIEIMGEYRSHKRENAVMRTLAARLSEEEIAALAAYFGSLVEVSTKP